jgi:vancomycin resistance protein YoaR
MSQVSSSRHPAQGGATRPPAGRPPARRRRRRLNPWLRLILLTVGALLLIVGVGAALAIDDGDGDAPDQVSVAGVDVSGLSPEEVEQAVRYRARQLMAVPVVIERTDDPSTRVTSTRAALGARPRVQRAVQEALEARPYGGRVLTRLGLASTREVPLSFRLNARKVDALVGRVSSAVDKPAVPARLRVGRDDITVLKGRGGFGVDPVALRRRIEQLPQGVILVSVGPLAPPVSEAAAEEARERALRIVAAPVEVTFQDRGVAIEPDVLRSALRFQPVPPRLGVSLDPEVLHEDIASAFETREQPARDATFRVSGSSVRLVPSRIGRSLDMEAIAADIVANPGTSSVRARFEVSRPERTTAEARGLRITELVSEFTTPYNCCEPRVTNIQRAAEILNGMIIPAGRAFSLNDALGPRTLDRGFVEAPQIAAGRLEDAVGGGVSQVATTLYNAAFFAGLELVAHTPHQFYISRYPEGREATVSLGGPELIFVNDWDAAILISAQAGSNGIAIRFFSSTLGRRVETETGPRRDIVQPRVRETVNPDLAPGEREVKQELGGEGFTVSYTRKVWDGDDLKRDENFTSRYSPQDAFVEVGPKRKPPARKPSRTAPGEPTAPDGGGTGTTTQPGGTSPLPAPPP